MCINPSEFEDLRQKVEDLQKVVNNLKQECQRLYQQGYSDGVGAVIKDMLSEKIKEHASTSWDKWVEVNVNKFERTNILTKEEIYNQMKVTQIDPVEAEYYRQVDKAIKGEECHSDPREYLDCYNEHDGR